jgi:hypothetical protein
MGTVSSKGNNPASKKDESRAESTPRLNATLARAKAAAGKINDATDRLTHNLEEVEAALVEIKLGVWGGVIMPGESDPGVDYEARLSFRRFEGKWGLFVERGPANGDLSNMSVTPLSKASRALRLEAAELLPELVELLVTKAEVSANEAVQRAADMGMLAAALRKARS